MKLNIVEFIQFIRKRPNMIFYKANENLSLNYINFFEGFLYGLEYNNPIDLERELSKWYQERVKFKAPNMNWFAQFESVNENLSETEKIEKLLDTLEEFFLNHDLKNYSLK
jgi:hypothetical protein